MQSAAAPVKGAISIGFIGLGRMGSAIALNLIRAGHRLNVHDVRPEATAPHVAVGAQRSASPMLAAAGAQVIFTCLPGPVEIEAAALGAQGIVHGAASGALYVDLSSGAPSVIRRIHGRLAERGIRVLDAPVSGGVTGAERGTLQIMVGGEKSAFDALLPILQTIGDKISHTGEIGSGTIAKLVHNLVYIATRSVLAEGFTLGVKAGVRCEVLLEVMKGGAFGQGLMLAHFMPEMVFKDQFEPVRFTMHLARKDVGLATELARELDVPMPMSALAEQMLVEAMARGWGDRDYGVQFLMQEERAGVQVRAKAKEPTA